jgi:hypothetical protein
MSHVAVWMTNYASERYIGDAIRSVLNQSHRDLTLYIADNHSPGDDVKHTLNEMSRPRMKVLDVPKGLAGIPLMKFCWDYLNTTQQDYSITIGGHDVWESEHFLSTLVERISTDTYVKPAIVYPDTWQLNFDSKVVSRFPDIMQVAAQARHMLPQYVISGVNSPQLFGLWSESVRRRVAFRHCCSGWDHLVVAEAAVHGTILFEPRVRLLMRAPSADDDLTKYGLRHLDPALLAAGAKDYIQQLEWILYLVDQVTEDVPSAARPHYRMMLITSMFCTYNALRGQNLSVCPGAGDEFYKLPEVQQIFGAAKHIEAKYRELIKRA